MPLTAGVLAELESHGSVEVAVQGEAGEASMLESAVRLPRLGMTLGVADADTLRRLDRAESVSGIFPAVPHSILEWPHKPLRAEANGHLGWSLNLVRGLQASGLTGRGIRVAHLDSGVDHPALDHAMSDFVDVDEMGRVHPPPQSRWDLMGHGTNTAGTLCGDPVDGMEIGVAPGINLFSAIVLDNRLALRTRLLAGLEWALEKEARIVTISVGLPGRDAGIEQAVSTARQHGTLVVAAIGNDGPGTTRAPGNAPVALSVGAVDQADRIWPFSSSECWPQETPARCAPVLLAPGVDVHSAGVGSPLEVATGSSMAAPFVAGVAALLWEARPASSADQIASALMSSCTPPVGSNGHDFALGMIQPEQALEWLEEA